MCTGLLVVDTLLSLAPDAEVRGYKGQRVREHEDLDPPETRRARLLRSIDSTFAFRFTKESLVRALRDAGFTSVLECHAPLEPGRAEDRITLAARRGEAVSIASYPWVNGASEEEIARRIDSMQGGSGGR